MNYDLILGIINIVLISTTPLVFAGIGELVTEKSGVLNLGLEGLMLVGAVSGFISLVITGNYFYSFILSILSGVVLSTIFAFLGLIIRTFTLFCFLAFGFSSRSACIPCGIFKTSLITIIYKIDNNYLKKYLMLGYMQSVQPSF